MQDDEPLYWQAQEVSDLALQVITDHPDSLDHLTDAKIVYLFSREPMTLRGRQAAAICFMPDAQGQNRKVYAWLLETVFFEPVDVMVMVDHEFWQECDQRQKTALVYHELLHIRQKESKNGSPMFSKETGQPVLQLIDHDLGEFFAVAQEFGAWERGLQHMQRILNGEKVNAES